MREKVFYDTLTVSKGPEDGMSFSITSTPILVGRSPDCLVNVQFDITIQPEHALISLGRGCYRVRRLTGAPVCVDGKRAGRIRSRRLGEGESLRVGYTELVLRCAEGGHAATGSRSWSESDAAWAFRLILGVGRDAAGFAFSHFKKLARTAAAHWFWSLVILAVIAYLAIPPVREWANGWVAYIRRTI